MDSIPGATPRRHQAITEVVLKFELTIIEKPLITTNLNHHINVAPDFGST